MGIRETFKFSTKAETLEALRPLLPDLQIPQSVFFSVSEWHRTESACVNRIIGLRSKVVVRSSTLFEDGYNESLAGNFESVLDVKPTEEHVRRAVETVIESYRLKGFDDSGNQVLVQPQIEDVQLSGVIFTHDPENGAPYYIVSYDDLSGRTDQITSGQSEMQNIFTFCSLFDDLPSDPVMRTIVEAIRSIESATQHPGLDIEFAMKDGKFVLLQCRPIANLVRREYFSDKELKETLEHVKMFLSKQMQPFPNLSGSSSAYGIMPDWNPAEIIGVDPRPLAFSLYRYLITDDIWPLSRKMIGYRDVGRAPGICSLAGKPYVDIRVSFNTFTPAEISDQIATKLVDFYIHKLRHNQDFHDKVEFNIVFSCYTFSFDEVKRELSQNGFGAEEIAQIRAALLEQTRGIIEGRTYPIGDLLKSTEELKVRRDRVLSSDMSLFDKISQLSYDCREFGTLPFSILARYAFISSIMLRSLVAEEVMREDEREGFMTSIDTVATGFLRKLGHLKEGSITREDFLEEFGHLRPGTYDISSLTYAEAFDSYVDIDNFAQVHDAEEYVVSSDTKTKIDKVLNDHGFEITSEQFLTFARRSLQAREGAKFEFTKNLSILLDLVELAFEEFGFSRDDLSYLEIDDVLALSHRSISAAAMYHLREKIHANRMEHKMSKLIRLPPVIFLPRNVQYFQSTDVMPNYITRKVVSGDVIDLSESDGPTNGYGSLEGKIVLISRADPGYDWIFSHSIAALVTEFGGAASHMAIRAAEFQLPAVIGCGTTLFSLLKGCRRIEIDCASRRVTPLST